MSRHPEHEPDVDEYFGVSLLTRADEERATEDTYRRINDADRYRLEPWTAALP